MTVPGTVMFSGCDVQLGLRSKWLGSGLRRLRLTWGQLALATVEENGIWRTLDVRQIL